MLQRGKERWRQIQDIHLDESGGITYRTKLQFSFNGRARAQARRAGQVPCFGDRLSALPMAALRTLDSFP